MASASRMDANEFWRKVKADGSMAWSRFWIIKKKCWIFVKSWGIAMGCWGMRCSDEWNQFIGDGCVNVWWEVIGCVCGLGVVGGLV
jgi:hypothetical protein